MAVPRTRALLLVAVSCLLLSVRAQTTASCPNAAPPQDVYGTADLSWSSPQLIGNIPENVRVGGNAIHNKDVTFQLVVNIPAAPSIAYVIFEAGAKGTGFSLLLIGNDLHLTHCSSSNFKSIQVSFTPYFGNVTRLIWSFSQIQNPSQIVLWVNGEQVKRDTFNGDDWAGINNAFFGLTDPAESTNPSSVVCLPSAASNFPLTDFPASYALTPLELYIDGWDCAKASSFPTITTTTTTTSTTSTSATTTTATTTTTSTSTSTSTTTTITTSTSTSTTSSTATTSTTTTSTATTTTTTTTSTSSTSTSTTSTSTSSSTSTSTSSTTSTSTTSATTTTATTTTETTTSITTTSTSSTATTSTSTTSTSATTPEPQGSSGAAGGVIPIVAGAVGAIILLILLVLLLIIRPRRRKKAEHRDATGPVTNMFYPNMEHSEPATLEELELATHVTPKEAYGVEVVNEVAVPTLPPEDVYANSEIPLYAAVNKKKAPKQDIGPDGTLYAPLEFHNGTTGGGKQGKIISTALYEDLDKLEGDADTDSKTESPSTIRGQRPDQTIYAVLDAGKTFGTAAKVTKPNMYANVPDQQEEAQYENLPNQKESLYEVLPGEEGGASKAAPSPRLPPRTQTMSATHTSKPWFHGSMSQAQARERLKEENAGPGSFLVCSTAPDTYDIAVLFGGQVFHNVVRFDGKEYVLGDGEGAYSSLQDLIDQASELMILQTVLGAPVNKDAASA